MSIVGPRRAWRPVLAALALAASTAALALPDARSTLYLQAGRNAGDDPFSGSGTSGSRSYDDAGSSSYGAWQAQATANAGTGMGGSEPAIGWVSVDAMVDVQNFPAQAVATGGATLAYYFEVQPNDRHAHPGLAEIPMSYSVRGSGEVSAGSGRIIGWATIDVPGYDRSACGFNYEGSVASRSFGACGATWWAPATGASYYVVLSGTATAYNFAYPYGSAESQAAVSVDPIIGFDQAAFDAKYGSQSFDLAAAYSIRYSALPVPEPASAGLLALGLAALALRRRALAAR